MRSNEWKIKNISALILNYCVFRTKVCHVGTEIHSFKIITKLWNPLRWTRKRGSVNSWSCTLIEKWIQFDAYSKTVVMLFFVLVGISFIYCNFYVLNVDGIDNKEFNRVEFKISYCNKQFHSTNNAKIYSFLQFSKLRHVWI